ncbi:MAG: SDR family NAD(P)-dependent oxidoreductase, partial [Chloroflexota bacterium]
MAENRLGNQVAIVTGASRGIGRAVARLLAAEGARVVLVARNAETLDWVEKEIGATGGEAFAAPADVTSKNDVQRVVAETLKRYGRIDILVNNAGVASARKPVVELDDESWKRVIDGNLTGTFMFCREVLPAMLKAGYGRIVSISSRVGLAGHVLGTAAGGTADADYAVGKAGVVTLTKALALEVAPKGITVNAIAPGPIVTDMLASAGEQEIARRATLIP